MKLVLFVLAVVVIAFVGLTIHLLGERGKKQATQFKELWYIVLGFDALTLVIGLFMGFHLLEVQFLIP